jgi:hypothetical protein
VYTGIFVAYLYCVLIFEISLPLHRKVAVVTAAILPLILAGVSISRYEPTQPKPKAIKVEPAPVVEVEQAVKTEVPVTVKQLLSYYDK